MWLTIPLNVLLLALLKCFISEVNVFCLFFWSLFPDFTWLLTATEVTALLLELARVRWRSTMFAQENARYGEQSKYK